MKHHLITIVAGSLIAASAITGTAFAQDAIPGHPRVSEVDQRLDNQQNRVDSNAANGNMTAKQAARDDKRDARVQRQLNRDQAKNGGHITKAEQAHMNKELNHNSKDIHRQHDNGVAAKTPAP